MQQSNKREIMIYMNKFLAMGHLTRNIELKYLTNGIATAAK